MPESITRRSFIKGSTALTVTSILGGSIDGWIHKPAYAATEIDIAAVHGADYFQNTIKAVELLGGMGKFVSKQAKVGLLINSPWDNPGSYVRPDVALAVLRMCREAGAKEIGVFKDLSNGYWKRSVLAEKFGDDIKSIASIGGVRAVPRAPHPGQRVAR
ncbi:MAG: twin-arginine translocation signal domain-containing protein [Desulfobulbaceae bacterium]|nr:twin-arginine translocation signal domain-containing protein [Desulfobulbaceae bacterium]